MTRMLRFSAVEISIRTLSSVFSSRRLPARSEEVNQLIPITAIRTSQEPTDSSIVSVGQTSGPGPSRTVFTTVNDEDLPVHFAVGHLLPRTPRAKILHREGGDGELQNLAFRTFFRQGFRRREVPPDTSRRPFSFMFPAYGRRRFQLRPDLFLFGHPACLG
jgi:hypothetical protein